MREYFSDDPVGDSRRLFDALRGRAEEEPLDNGHGVMANMDDGSTVTYRVETKSGDSPAVEVHNSKSNIVKDHKVHFRKKE